MQLLKDLIAIESVSGQERVIQKYIYSHLKKQSMEVFTVAGNTVGYVAGGNPRKAIIFNGHIDTVPVANPEQWRHAPFGAEAADGKCYGRGTSDMKGAVAAMMQMLIGLAETKPECDVFFMAVNGEETDGNGTKACLKWWQENYQKQYADVAVVIGEPTGLESYVYGQRGNYFLNITTTGQTGHGSRPELISEHAILKMYHVAEVMRKLGEEWGEAASVAFTTIHGGVAISPNIFAPICEATFDIRTTPAVHGQVVAEVNQQLSGLAVVEIPYDPFPPAYTDPESAICRATQRATGLNGREVRWATDMCHFAQAGIPGVIIGPGEESQLHATDEYCVIEKVDRAVQIYRDIITEYAN